MKGKKLKTTKGKIVTGVIFLAIAVVGVYAAMDSREKVEVTQEAEKISPIAVQAEKVSEEIIPLSFDYPGAVIAETTKKYSASIGGQITELNVEVGDKVSPGEVIARIDVAELNYSLQAANQEIAALESQFELNKKLLETQKESSKIQTEKSLESIKDAYNFARKNYERSLTLYEKEIISGVELEEIEREKEKLKNNFEKAEVANKAEKEILDTELEKAVETGLQSLEQARIRRNKQESRLNDAEIRSDMNGVVMDILYESGETVQPGAPIILIQNDAKIVKAQVDVDDISYLEKGVSATITSRDKETPGEIIQVSQGPTDTPRSYPVKISLDENKGEEIFMLGEVVNVSFHQEEKEGVWIPISAVLTNALGEDYVYLVEDDIAARREITQVTNQENRVKVEGINPGEKVVVQGMLSLGDGVSVLPNKEKLEDGDSHEKLD